MTSTRTPLSRVRAELVSALQALQNERDLNAELEKKVERASDEVQRAARLRTDLEIQLRSARRDLSTALQHPPLFERMSFEKFTRAQLVSFIEQAINEARRKGMLEAEGLLSRHRELTESTDLEMMRGVVQTYQARIAVIEADQSKRKAQTLEPVRLDTRPLSEKLQPAGKTILPKTAKSTWAPAYWFNAPPEMSYRTFDERAKAIEAEARAKQATPNTLLNNQSIDVHGDTGIYTLGRLGEVYSCTCPAWRHQAVATDRRTCKHLKRHLGAEVEEKRIARPQKSCWCGVILVNGQCQIHTQDWRGDEYCNCGRRFSHCKEEFRTGRAPTRAWHEPRLRGTPEPVHAQTARTGMMSY